MVSDGRKNRSVWRITHKKREENIVEINYNPAEQQQNEANMFYGAATTTDIVTSSNPFKNIAKIIGNTAPPNKYGDITRAMISSSTEKKFPSLRVESAALKYLTPTFRDMATSLGYASFNEFYARIRSGGSGLLNEAKDILNSAKDSGAKRVDEANLEANKKLNAFNEGNDLYINVVTDYEESYKTEVPLKRVEGGFDVASYVYNPNEEYSFSGFITDVRDVNGNILVTTQDIKNELKRIRETKTTFNMQNTETEEFIEECLFTSLSFKQTSNGINGYDVSFSVIPIKKGEVQTVQTLFKATNIGSKAGAGGKAVSTNKEKKPLKTVDLIKSTKEANKAKKKKENLTKIEWAAEIQLGGG